MPFYMVYFKRKFIWHNLQVLRVSIIPPTMSVNFTNHYMASNRLLEPGMKGSSSHLISQVITAFTVDFEMKDLGLLHYFLGLQISYTLDRLFVSQTKYINELVDKVDLQESKPCATPCLPYHRLLKDDGKPYHSSEQYRSVVGALQYLTFTRPDIVFSVNQACQYMHNPMVSHVIAVKQIIRYLKGTSTYGIYFKPGPMHLQAYRDADWAGDPNDRRLTSGFVVFLGSNPISCDSTIILLYVYTFTFLSYDVL
ncbi:uncharacterized mitochondrial protein AtMg00810-like [Malus domestica]|uniref:uncharacterized mitochondrial protein AtMg00810-like n=1 Tax=Malus domestica TaxID=3750 RepID=UPI003974CB7F